ncbi:MAG: hypothetical protein GY882_11680 [Actinomycetia bacterium]|nr:hypothetical protein [Actinomycetes bacterium]
MHPFDHEVPAAAPMPSAGQMHLFSAADPDGHTTLTIDVAGDLILVSGATRTDHTGTPAPASYPAIRELFATAGIAVTDDPVRGLSFPAASLSAVADLGAGVAVCARGAAGVLWDLASNPPQRPVTLDAAGSSVVLSWFDGSEDRSAVLAGADVAGLLALDLAVVATPAAWAVIDAAGTDADGHSTVTTADGHLVVSSRRPQLVETAGLPAMWRIAPDRFGMPARHLEALSGDSGFIVDPSVTAPRPRRISHADVALLPFEVSAHHHAPLAAIVEALSTSGRAMLRWDAGTGRRLMALVAAEILGAWPVVVVAAPQDVWAWTRHAELLGRSWTMSRHDAEMRIVTPADVARGLPLSEPGCLVVDDAAGMVASRHAGAVVRATKAWRSLRIALGTRLPNDPDSAAAALEMVAPAEFSSSVTVAARYVPTADVRAAEHVAAHTIQRQRSNQDPAAGFRRSNTVAVDLSRVQRQAAEAALERRTGDVAGVVADLLEVVTCGPAQAVSPKLVAAAELVRSCAGSSVVLTRHRRATQLLRSLLRPMRARIVDAAAGPLVARPGVPVIVRYDHRIGDLSSFDNVVFCDLPFSLEYVSDAVGSAADPQGPGQVTVLHTPGSIDDRLVVLAALRAERAGVVDGSSALSAEEVAYLLHRP